MAIGNGVRMLQAVAVMQMLIGARGSLRGSVYDKTPTENQTGAMSMANGSDLFEDAPLNLTVQNVTANGSEDDVISNAPMLSLLAAGSGQSFYAKVCAGLNCHGSIPLSNVHHFGEALVGKNGATCVAAFRGTANAADVVQDVASLSAAPLPGCPGCMVGSGFLGGFRGLAGQVKGALKSMGCNTVVVTGHSLGAARGALALYELAKEGYHISTSYLFGGPWVGNGAFAAAFRQTVHAQVFRVEHGQDPVPKVGLPGGVPVGTLIYEPGNSVLTDHVHYSGVHMFSCMPDELPGGKAVEQVVEHAMSSAECCLKGLKCCKIPSIQSIPSWFR